ncbi:MAG: hypothetical protein ABFE13_10195 [Phycisphaerales bacterium]
MVIALFFCCLVGCRDQTDAARQNTAPGNSAGTTISFLEQQKRLFHEIDHTSIFQGCQDLMRLRREGRLSASTYYCDDPGAKLGELPERIRTLQPTAVRVDELMVRMSFLSEDGVQFLQCMSNEFGEPLASDGETKGFGFRTEPFAMDQLSGTESLDHLNATYKHFELSLIPGLTYQVFDDSPRTLAEMKQNDEQSNTMFAFMWRTMNELAVKKQRLLYRTDHHALLEACREVLKHFHEGTFSTDKIDITPPEFLENAKRIDKEEYAGDLKQIPAIILGLEPVYLWLSDNRVTVALIGGLDHAGIHAYLKDAEAEPQDDDMELIPGLRYYDDGLAEDGEGYKDYLKSLEQEAIPPIDWRRKQMNLPLPARK